MVDEVGNMALWIAKYVCQIIVFMQINSVLCLGENDLLSSLFKSYKKIARPRFSSNATVTVSLGFSLALLDGLDLRNQAMTTSGWLTMEWIDEYLIWEPNIYQDIHKVVVPATMVWLPDIAVDNSVANIYEPSHINDFRVTIYHDGTVVWEPGGTFKTTCDMDISSYPFDHQTCTLVFANWMYTKEQVNLITADDKVTTETYTENGEWDIEYTKIKATEWSLSTKPKEIYPEVDIVIHVRRKYLYYLVNMLIPCLMMSLLVLVVFQLPPDSGEKISLGVTVLLAFSVFQLMIAENVPSTSKSLPMIDFYLLFFMGESTFSVAISVLVLNFHHRTEYKPPPQWLRTLVLNWMACILCMKRQRNNQVRSQFQNESETHDNEFFGRQIKGQRRTSLEKNESELLTSTFRIEHETEHLTPTIHITTDNASSSGLTESKVTESRNLIHDHSFQTLKPNDSCQEATTTEHTNIHSLSPDIAKSAVKLMRSIATLDHSTSRHSRDEILAVIRDTYRQICQQRKDDELDALFENEWKRIAKVVDKFFFIVTTCFIIISSVVVFCFIPFTHPDMQ